MNYAPGRVISQHHGQRRYFSLLLKGSRVRGAAILPEQTEIKYSCTGTVYDAVIDTMDLGRLHRRPRRDTEICHLHRTIWPGKIYCPFLSGFAFFCKALRSWYSHMPAVNPCNGPSLRPDDDAGIPGRDILCITGIKKLILHFSPVSAR